MSNSRKLVKAIIVPIILRGMILQKATKMSFLFLHKNDLALTNSQDMLPCSDLKKSHTLFVALEKGYNSLVQSSYVLVTVESYF